MEIKVLGAVGKKRHINQYEVVHSWMSGDADGFGDERIWLNKSQESELPGLISLFEMMNLAYPNGKAGYDDYTWIPMYWKYTESDWYPDDMSEEEAEEIQQNCPITIDQPSIGCGDGAELSFKGYKIFFWDENSVRRNVRVTFTEEEIKDFKEKVKEARKKR